MESRVLALLGSVAILASSSHANADEIKPKAPDEIVFSFRNGPALWSLRVNSSGNQKTVQIFCNGKLMMSPKLPDKLGWKIVGDVIGAELVDYSKS